MCGMRYRDHCSFLSLSLRIEFKGFLLHLWLAVITTICIIEIIAASSLSLSPYHYLHTSPAVDPVRFQPPPLLHTVRTIHSPLLLHTLKNSFLGGFHGLFNSAREGLREVVLCMSRGQRVEMSSSHNDASHGAAAFPTSQVQCVAVLKQAGCWEGG